MDTTPNTLVAKSRRIEGIWKESCAKFAAAQRALEASLTPEQAALFDTFEGCMQEVYAGGHEKDMTELCRHLPAFAAAIDALYWHIIEDGQVGVCCPTA